MQPRHNKAQSAMEYLMTYGWAILIIAIVLAALFQLGVFNSTNFAPKAPPGACQVFRPNGPGTTSFISTEGECNGELPQYVANFNGVSSHITASLSILKMSSVTLTAWMYLNEIPSSNTGIVGLNPANQCGALSMFPNGNCHIQPCLNSDTGQFATDSGTCVSSRRWYFVAVYSNQTSKTFGVYVNGQINNQSFSGNTISADEMDIGEFESQGAWFNGYISNVQVYNTSLSTNDITSLYQEGIGGAPIDLQNLVGWWPLNGNSNDYSGNNNNGVPNGVTYTSNWVSGYAAP